MLSKDGEAGAAAEEEAEQHHLAWYHDLGTVGAWIAGVFQPQPNDAVEYRDDHHRHAEHDEQEPWVVAQDSELNSSYSESGSHHSPSSPSDTVSPVTARNTPSRSGRLRSTETSWPTDGPNRSIRSGIRRSPAMT